MKKLRNLWTAEAAKTFAKIGIDLGRVLSIEVFE